MNKIFLYHHAMNMLTDHTLTHDSGGYQLVLFESAGLML